MGMGSWEAGRQGSYEVGKLNKLIFLKKGLNFLFSIHRSVIFYTFLVFGLDFIWTKPLGQGGGMSR